MRPLIPRHAFGLASEIMATFPALIIQGARQVGKSTFAGQLVEGLPATTVTLDDDDMRLAALADPRGFVGQRPDGTLAIDELQRVPELILAIKAEIDRDRRPGRFLLTGSSNLLALSKTPDSLAGRAVDIELQGLSQGELQGTLDDLPARLRQGIDGARWQNEVTRAGYAARITCGGYPEARDVTTRMRNVWFDGYVARLLEKDLVDIESRVDPGRVASVLRLLAANQSGELVKARVARDAGISESSVTACLDLLSTLYLTSTLRPWTPNLTKREASRPKVIVNDPGLALRLARLREEQLTAVPSDALGPALEGFVVSELRKQRIWNEEEFELFHFRDRTGPEVDIVLEFGDGSVVGIEVKASSTYRSEHFSGLRFLRDRLGDRFLGGYVLSLSDRGISMGDRLCGLPVSALWETR